MAIRSTIESDECTAGTRCAGNDRNELSPPHQGPPSKCCSEGAHLRSSGLFALTYHTRHPRTLVRFAPKAFLVVPLVGALFTDIVNALVIMTFPALPLLRGGRP